MTEQYIDKDSYQALIKIGDIVSDPLKDNTKDPKYGLWYIEKSGPIVPGLPANVNLKKLNEDLQIGINNYIKLDIDKNLKDEEIIARLNDEFNSKREDLNEIKKILKPENDGIERTEESQESKQNSEMVQVGETYEYQGKNGKTQVGEISNTQGEDGERVNGVKLLAQKTPAPAQKTPEPTGGKRKSKKSKKTKKSKKSKTRKNSRKTNRRR
jgi:uncharacterized phage infection (PIP) family protein YhgE